MHLAANSNPMLILVTCLLLGWIGISQIILLISYLKLEPFWPEDAPRPVSWNSRGVFAVILLWIAMQYAAVFAVSTVSKRLGNTELLISSALMNLGLIRFAPRFLSAGSDVVVRVADLIGPNPGRNFRRGSRNWGFLALWIYGLYLACLQIWTSTKHPLEEMMRRDLSPQTLTIAVLSGVILTPIGEELLFRGALLGWLTKLTLPAPMPSVNAEFTEVDIVDGQRDQTPVIKPLLSFWLVNILVSIVFSLMHWQVWPSPVPIFLLSLGLGVLYQKTGGLAAPIGLHMAFNGISTTIFLLGLASGAAKAP